MDQLFDNGELTPFGKAAVVADILMRCSPLMEAVSYDVLFHQVKSRFGMPEEVIGGAIHDSSLFLASKGVIELLPKNDTIGAQTTVRGSRELVALIWDEPEGDEEAA